MKIALLSKQAQFAGMLVDALRKQTSHEILMWKAGEKAPADDLDGIITAFAPAGREQMAGQTRLAFLQTASAGYETVDVDAANELGVWVSYCPSEDTGNAVSVAEHALMLMMGTARHLRTLLAFTEQRSAEKPVLGSTLEGKSACIIGLGGIGGEIVKRLRPFGMKLSAVSSHADEAPEGLQIFPRDRQAEALGGADFVILCVPATSENENMVDAEFLAAMKQGSILINIARGVLVDETALLKSVNDGHLAGVGLDVVRDEPVEPSNPLLTSLSILVTPHTAGATDLMLHGTVAYVAKALDQYAAGQKPKSVINEPKHPRLALK